MNCQAGRHRSSSLAWTRRLLELPCASSEIEGGIDPGIDEDYDSEFAEYVFSSGAPSLNGISRFRLGCEELCSFCRMSRCILGANHVSPANHRVHDCCVCEAATSFSFRLSARERFGRRDHRLPTPYAQAARAVVVAAPRGPAAASIAYTAATAVGLPVAGTFLYFYAIYKGTSVVDVAAQEAEAAIVAVGTDFGRISESSANMVVHALTVMTTQVSGVSSAATVLMHIFVIVQLLRTVLPLACWLLDQFSKILYQFRRLVRRGSTGIPLEDLPPEIPGEEER